MKIVIGSDHAGYDHKVKFIEYLNNKGYEVIDVGTDSNASVDYPLFGYEVGKKVIENKCFGIAICGSGIGISIACNKVDGIRAVNCNNEDLARLSRLHNDANVICFGQRLVKFEDCIKLFEIFINEKFLGDRHLRRVDELNEGC